MLLQTHFPSWLSPEIIPGLPFRWYGLMYVVAFGVAFLLYRRQVKERNFPMSEDNLASLFFWGILSLLVGARLFSALIYDTSGIYIMQPHLIFWPFRNGQFTGLEGMSYHGGVVGGVLSIIIWSRAKKFDAREIGDMYAASIPLGYAFGRLGNFINGELYGRITASPLGMVFPRGGISPSDPNFERIREGAEAMGITGILSPGGVLNYPRHPSQLYQLFFEGILLWAIIWFFRNRKPFKGFLITLYLGGLGFFRFIIEYFREPDSHIGYSLQFVFNDLPLALGHPAWSFSTGQVLSFIMMLGAVLWTLIAINLPGKEPVRDYAAEKIKPQKSLLQKAEERNRRRKLRNKLR